MVNIDASATYRWLGGFALALLGHAVVTGGLMYQVMTTPPDGTGAPVHVELAGDFAAPVRVEVADAQNKALDEPPEPSQSAKEVTHSPPLPEPIPAPKLTPGPDPEPPEKERIKQPPADNTTSTVAAKQAVVSDPDPENTPTNLSTVPSLPVVTANQRAKTVQAPSAKAQPSTHIAGLRASWQGRVKAHLERHKRYPHRARARREQGTARVRFALDRRGGVQAVYLEESAGFPLLDREVHEALRRAQPLPEPPAELSGEVLELIWRVEFALR